MYRPLSAFICLFCLTLIATSALAASDIRFTSTVEVEVQQKNTAGETVLVRLPADTVEPGEAVIYTNSFTNTGKQPADNIVINMPVPENTVYLDGSGSETGYEVVFSIDRGVSFAKPEKLTVSDSNGSQRQALAEEYTNLRWTKLAPLVPGATGVTEFRVRIK